MANLVGQIRSGITSVVTTQLGADYNEIRHIYEPEQNDIRTGTTAYAVRALGGDSIEGVLKNYTLSQEFEVMLMTAVVKRTNDQTVQDEIDTLYSKADDILKNVLASKLSLPTIVLDIQSPSLSEPEILENSTVLIRVGFSVLYRSALV